MRNFTGFLLAVSFFCVGGAIDRSPTFRPTPQPSPATAAPSFYREEFNSTFSQVSLLIRGREVRKPFEFDVFFAVERNIGPEEEIIVRLPRFTRLLNENGTSSNVTYADGGLLISPSFFFRAEWIDGSIDSQNVPSNRVPFLTSKLRIQTKSDYVIMASDQIRITVFKENGIGAICGFPSHDYYSRKAANQFSRIHVPRFEIFTAVTREITQNETVANATYREVFGRPTAFYDYSEVEVTKNVTNRRNDTFHITNYFPGVGYGCDFVKDCNGNGVCDYCFERCHCYDGYGSANDLVTIGRDINVDCRQKVCPVGKAFVDLPTAADKAHALAECSNVGVCNRDTGQCQCYPPFSGAACEKVNCPNDCSGHGQCVPIQDISRVRALRNNYSETGYITTTSDDSYRRTILQSPDVFDYGTGNALDTTAWDFRSIFGCVCDSSWNVGYLAGQRQLSEYFGADCSLRHCPSGDNPFTREQEDVCFNKNQNPNDRRLGQIDNQCHIDCSNRGNCDFRTGKCSCYEGSWGNACENVANAGDVQIYLGSDSNQSTFRQFN